MGVSYNTTIGYGFVISEKKLTKRYPDRVEEEGVWEVIDDLLAKKYPLLEMEYAGDAYSGYTDGWVVFAKSTSLSLDGYRIHELTRLGGDIDAEALDQLTNAHKKFGKGRLNMFAANSVG